MTMLIPRDPLSICGAIALVIETLGGKRVADALGVAKVTVYRWSSEDESSLPNVDQAVRLDAYWVAQTQGRDLAFAGAPVILPAILRHFRELTGVVESTAPAAPITGEALAAETMDLTSALGLLCQAITLARKDGKICETDRKVIRKSLAGVMLECADMDRATRKRRK